MPFLAATFDVLQGLHGPAHGADEEQDHDQCNFHGPPDDATGIKVLMAGS